MKPTELFQVIKREKLYREATILFIAISFSNLCNLLYHLFMVRALSPQDYGILNTLFACILFFAMPTGNIQVTLTKFIAHYHGLGCKGCINEVLKGMSLRILFIGGLIWVIMFSFSPEIASFFKIDKLGPIYAMAGVVVSSLLFPIPSGGLQGLQRFWALGSTLIITNVIKLILAILLVVWGFGVTGALNSLTLSYILGILIAYPILWRNLRKLDLPEDKGEVVNFKQIYIYVLPVSLATLSFVLLTNLDLIYVKHYFSPLEAGHYSIAQVVGKIVLFLPSAIGMVMFPKVANSYAQDKETFSYFKHASFYIIALVLSSAFLILLLPELVIKIFTGKDYPQCIPLVRRFAMSMGAFAISFNFLLYYLSLNKVKYLAPFLIFLGIEGVLLYFWHRNLIQILNLVIVVAFSLLLINFFLIKKVKEGK